MNLWIVVRAMLVLTVLGAASTAAGPAGARGDFEGPALLPDPRDMVFQTGDRVHLVATDLRKSDPAWHGPYTVYLRPQRPDAGLAGFARAGEGPGDVAVGNLVVTRLDAAVMAEITFTMPRLDSGRYDVLTCNAQCANPLGDLVTTSIDVGVSHPHPVPTASAVVPRSTLPPLDGIETAEVQATSRLDDTSARSTTVEVTVPVTRWGLVGAAFGFGGVVASLTAWLVGSPERRRRLAGDRA